VTITVLSLLSAMTPGIDLPLDIGHQLVAAALH
jgi:hypothetical protein